MRRRVYLAGKPGYFDGQWFRGDDGDYVRPGLQWLSPCFLPPVGSHYVNPLSKSLAIDSNQRTGFEPLRPGDRVEYQGRQGTIALMPLAASDIRKAINSPIHWDDEPDKLDWERTSQLRRLPMRMFKVAGSIAPIPDPASEITLWRLNGVDYRAVVTANNLVFVRVK